MLSRPAHVNSKQTGRGVTETAHDTVASGSILSFDFSAKEVAFLLMESHSLLQTLAHGVTFSLTNSCTNLTHMPKKLAQSLQHAALQSTVQWLLVITTHGLAD